MPSALILAVSAFCLVLSGPALAGGRAAKEPVATTAADDATTADSAPTDSTGSEAPGTDVTGGEANGSDAEVAEASPADGDDEAASADDAGDETTPAEAEEEGWLPGELSANVDLVSDYIFRGITNTDHNPAIQAGLSYTVDVGVPYAQPYVGFWGSNVDFNDGGEATVELDLSFGLTGTVAGVEWDLGGLYYAYPGARSDLNYNYWEVPLQLTYPIGEHFSLLGQYAYSPNFFGDFGPGPLPPRRRPLGAAGWADDPHLRGDDRPPVDRGQRRLRCQRLPGLACRRVARHR